MLIYANFSSERVLPYVYKCIHRETGEFYIGSRANKKQTLPSHLDFPQYKTSSKKVKPRFDEFDWFIVAEFFNPIDAYTFEQQLIFENWDNPLKLNDACHFNNEHLFTTIRKSYKHTADTKSKISAAKRGVKRSPAACEAMSASRKGKTRECSQKQREHLQHIAKSRPPISDETRAKLSAAAKKRCEDNPDTMRKRAAKAREAKLN